VEEKTKTSLLGRTLRVRCFPGAIVKEIGDPTVAFCESCEAQAGSDVPVIVPAAVYVPGPLDEMDFREKSSDAVGAEAVVQFGQAVVSGARKREAPSDLM
jgi:hypothetical protein